MTWPLPFAPPPPHPDAEVWTTWAREYSGRFPFRVVIPGGCWGASGGPPLWSCDLRLYLELTLGVSRPILRFTKPWWEAVIPDRIPDWSSADV